MVSIDLEKILTQISLIAYDLNNQKIVWTFQETAHDLWDADLSSPPILADINFKNNKLKVVIITTKLGNTFIFERISVSRYMILIIKKHQTLIYLESKLRIIKYSIHYLKDFHVLNL